MSGRDQRAAWYASPRWRATRKAWLKANPACVDCGGKASVVDHTLGHGPGWQERFYVGPFASRCWPCHSSKTVRREQGQRADGTFRRAGARPDGVGRHISIPIERAVSTVGATEDFPGSKVNRPAPPGSAEFMAARMRASWATRPNLGQSTDQEE